MAGEDLNFDLQVMNCELPDCSTPRKLDGRRLILILILYFNYVPAESTSDNGVESVLLTT